MSSRNVLWILGILMLASGVWVLFYPQQAMNWVGLAPLVPTQPAAALAEVRAIYAGPLVVLGGWALFAGFSPERHRDSILLMGLVWLGIGAARFFGLSREGTYQLTSVVFGVVELLVGALLLWCSFSAGRKPPLPSVAPQPSSAQAAAGSSPPGS